MAFTLLSLTLLFQYISMLIIVICTALYPRPYTVVRVQVVFNPGREFGAAFESDRQLQEKFIGSAIRLRFLEPADSSPLSSYYAISNLEIDAQCVCYGHAAVCNGEVGPPCVRAERSVAKTVVYNVFGTWRSELKSATCLLKTFLNL